jgi:CheY-like chemotaxis protein
MKILVVDDSKKNLLSAQPLVVDGHTVMAVSSYEEAIELLKPQNEYDVLLTDMLMPAEPYMLGIKGLSFLGHEIPIGFVLMLLAGLNGVKFAIMATDTNHHDHPMSASVDWLHTNPVRINGMLAWFTHAYLNADGSKDWKTLLERLSRMAEIQAQDA